MSKEESLHKIWKSAKRLEEKTEARRFEYVADQVKGKKVLDVGSLDARILKFLKKEVDYTSVDTREDFNKRLRKIGVKAITMNVCKESLPFPNNTFDTVIMGEIIEHLENPIFVLKEVKRVLKDDGVLVGTTPNICNLQHLIYSVIFKPEKRHHRTPSHIYAFGDEELGNLLRVVEFKDIEINRICSRLPHVQINLPDIGLFKIFSPYYLFVCKKGI